MVGVGSCGGAGRRLPQWMVGAGSAAGRDENSDGTKDAARTKTMRRVKESLVEDVSEGFRVLEKCSTTRRRKLKEKWEDGDSVFGVSEHKVEKKGNRVRGKLSEPASQKRLKTDDFGRSMESGIRNVNEDDNEDNVELTVEDLMIIAREYVRGDNNIAQDHALKGKCDRKSESTKPVPSRNGCSDNIGARIRNDATTTTRENGDSHNHVNDRHDASTRSFSKSKTSSSEEIAVSTSRTGDPAQDMLNLFLGPLLNKPANEKRTTFLSDDDVAFVPEIEIRKKMKTVGEELAPLVAKKKSSLKDKIAMLL